MVTINPLDIKKTVREWLEEKWSRHVQQPIERKTEQLENQVSQQFTTYSGKAREQFDRYSNQAKENAYKPVDYYRKQKTFHRGLFWIAICLLVILWILSGS